MITERLHRALAKIEQLPPEAQDELAEQLELWTEPIQTFPASRSRKRVAGIWRDRADLADMIEELERLRHEAPPTPPLEDLICIID
jgi:hypothetical protein